MASPDRTRAPIRPRSIARPPDGRRDAPARLIFMGLLAAFIALAAGIAGPARADEFSARFGKPKAGSSATIDHSAWDGLVKAYVKPGADGLNRVDYAAFKRDGHRKLKDYIAAIERADYAGLDRAEQFALLANLYNAKTIDVVLDKYPVKSIKDISLGGGLVATLSGGPWKAKITRLAGVELSLDNIEHDILRALFKDPRVHYAVNCASVGCPNLMAEAFTGAKLEAQLEAGARAYVNHPRGISVKGGRVTASSIYSWFKADFGGNDRGVLDHVAKYAGPELAAALKSVSSIAEYAYDWSLNDAPR